MTKSERTLLKLFASMDAAGQASLTEYAEFLAARHPAKEMVTSPIEIERPTGESVVSALKRLSHTYPMLDKQALLHETSSFMMQHMVQGRESVEVIDDMEIYFKQQYEQFSLRVRNDSDA